MEPPHVRLAALRDFHRLSRPDFGARIGCTPQMVRYVEKGERSLGRDHVLNVEAFSRLPGPDGVPWPEGPLLAQEWHHHKVPADAVEPAASHPAAPQPPLGGVLVGSSAPADAVREARS